MSQHDKRCTFTDASVNEIFERNHGAEARAYYGSRPVASANVWAATVDMMVGRGRCGRVAPRKGAE